MASYTYDDFVKAATSAGLLGEFSQWDLDVAMEHPEFGLSMLSLKQDIHSATTAEAKALAHTTAEQLRARYGNYSGGEKGNEYIMLLEDMTGRTNSQQAYDRLTNYGEYGGYDVAAPSYSSRFDSDIVSALQGLKNREEFSYDKDQDPNWSAYKKEYLREGDRATQNALAQAAVMTGGQPSSAAVTAASQAGDYYAAQLSDKLPTLYQQAYERYADEYSRELQRLSALQSQEQLDYNKYLTELDQYNTDRAFDYQQYLDRYDMLSGQYSAASDLDAAGREQTAYTQGIAQQQVDAILAAGGTPSATLLQQSGYTQEYAAAMEAFYRAQAAAGVSSGSSGGSSGNSGSSGSSSSGSTTGSSATGYDALYAAAYKDSNPQNYIASHYKEFGFTSSAGLWSGYQSWLESQKKQNAGLIQSKMNEIERSIYKYLDLARPDKALEQLDNGVWESMSAIQQGMVQGILNKYGLAYEP